MSWSARRFRERQRRRDTAMSSHHVPPKSKGVKFIIEVPVNRHRAYHLLFGACPTYQRACEILKRDWWEEL